MAPFIHTLPPLFPALCLGFLNASRYSQSPRVPKQPLVKIPVVGGRVRWRLSNQPMQLLLFDYAPQTNKQVYKAASDASNSTHS